MQTITFENWPYPKLIAHRGAGAGAKGLAPENTLAAFRVGYAHAYRMFEFDVKLSGDSKAVLMHDDTLERTTSAKGRLEALTLTELAQIDAGSWHSTAYAGESVPTLQAIVRYLRANQALANIEIKPTIGRERASGAAIAFDALTLWQDAADNDIPPLLSSFSSESLIAARDAAPQLPRAHLFEHPLPSDWLARCKAVGAVALDANYQSLTAEVIREAHAANLRVLTYTVNDPACAKTLFAWGLDSLISDQMSDQMLQGF